MGGPWGEQKLPVPGLQFGETPIDFVRMAQALGVPGERAATPADVHAALKRGLDATGPYVIEVDLPQ
jgi:thiamine pyrophosphate-dependent acetolactate synthase large subunit-like protein